MYPELFGNPNLRMYDIIGVVGYAFILIWFLLKKHRPTWGQALLLMAVHLIAYTFGGELLALVVGRATEFFGFWLIASVGTVLAAGAVGQSPLRWLDEATPLYLMMASVLKLSCFCSGCCRGRPWAYGFYSHYSGVREFPVQLAEMALYALLFWALYRYTSTPGRRFALGLMGYAGLRFVVQFFRVDEPTFSPFHWMSAVFFALGLLCYALFPRKKIEG